MNQALRLLENEHQELQAKIEHLQGDRDQCSLDTQDLQGTLSSEAWAAREPWLSELRGRKLGWREGFSLSFALLDSGFHFTFRARQGCFNRPRLNINFAALADLVL